MIMRRHKLTNIEITILGVIGAACVAASYFTLEDKAVSDESVLIRAAKKTQEAYRVIRESRMATGIPVDSIDDPAGSGLIGVASSSITTDPGDLEAKQTSINPNWAAVVVRYLEQAGVRPGECVAVGMTGSFPALDAAVLVGVQEFGARPIWIVSEGASTYGANMPAFTWLDMEQALYQKGIITGRALGASLGGNNNIGGGLPADGRDSLRLAIKRCGIPLIETQPLSSSIDLGMAQFKHAAGGNRIALYINVGGGLASLGTSQVSQILHSGLNPPKVLLDIQDEPVQGYAARFMKDGLQVFNVLDIVPLAHANKLPIAPAVTPEAGRGELFVAPIYCLWKIALLLAAYSAIVLAFAYGLTDILLKNPRKEML